VSDGEETAWVMADDDEPTSGNNSDSTEFPPTTSRSLIKVGMQVGLLGDEWAWVEHYGRWTGMGTRDVLSLAFLWGLTHLEFAKSETLIRMLIDRQRRLETELGNGAEGGQDSTPSDLPF
jgi:hypothetical protein